MWTLVLQLAVIALCTEGSTCDPSCTLNGLIAGCSSQSLRWVPALPPNITHLYLDLNYITEINGTALRGYQQLQELDLGWQRAPPLTIRSNAFLRQRRLTTLILGSNRQLQLEPRSFAGLFGLRHLFADYCGLSDAVMAGGFLQPLLSLESLDLSLNDIKRLRPGPFFSRLAKLTELNLKHNKIERLCEEDLATFRGKHFTVLNLHSNPLARAYDDDVLEQNCGNPFRDMSFQLLDVSLTGFNVRSARRFFRSIQGTSIAQLVFSGHIGQGFSFENLPDPEEITFEGLVDSDIQTFDMSKNRIFALKRAVFRHLRAAQIIDVSQNRINLIEEEAFGGLEGHLRMLNLSVNLLGEVRSHTFANLTDLRVLDLSYNHIGALGYEAFSDLPKLRALYLTGNSLRKLDSPASLPNLDLLLLGDNKLNSLYGLSSFANNSFHVDVSDNKLTNLKDVYSTVSSFKRLRNFFYNGNFIQWCALNKSMSEENTLRVLDLSRNFLEIIWARGECLDLFYHLPNLLSLSLSSNLLTRIPPGVFRGLRSVTEIFLSSNALTFLQPSDFPPSLRRLDLSYNFLSHPDPAMFRSLFFLGLAGNRFHCDCHLETFLHWLNGTNVTLLENAESYRCEFPSTLHDVPLLEFAATVEPCDVPDHELMFALFLLSSLLVAAVTLGGLVYARLRGRLFVLYKRVVGRVVEGPRAAAPPAGELQYDVFLCFSNNDYGWVEAALLKKLDNQFEEANFFHCCFEARDFLPGEDHLSNIRDAIWSSRKTVCVVSKEFLKDGWCLQAFTLAQSRMVEELTNTLILLVVGKVAHYQLMRFRTLRSFVEKREYLTWPEDPQDVEWFYERLVAQILKHTEVKRFAKDEVQQQQAPRQDHVELQEIGAATAAAAM